MGASIAVEELPFPLMLACFMVCVCAQHKAWLACSILPPHQAGSVASPSGKSALADTPRGGATSSPARGRPNALSGAASTTSVSASVSGADAGGAISSRAAAAAANSALLDEQTKAVRKLQTEVASIREGYAHRLVLLEEVVAGCEAAMRDGLQVCWRDGAFSGTSLEDVIVGLRLHGLSLCRGPLLLCAHCTVSVHACRVSSACSVYLSAAPPDSWPTDWAAGHSPCPAAAAPSRPPPRALRRRPPLQAAPAAPPPPCSCR